MVFTIHVPPLALNDPFTLPPYVCTVKCAVCMLTFAGVSSQPPTVGNKNDSPDRKVVLTEDAQRFSDQMGIRLFETSAKDNINVDEVCDAAR